MSKSSSSSSGIGFLGILTVMFVGLKLTGFIEWSWWHVLLPSWGPATAVLLIASIIFIVDLIKIWRKNR